VTDTRLLSKTNFMASMELRNISIGASEGFSKVA